MQIGHHGRHDVKRWLRPRRGNEDAITRPGSRRSSRIGRGIAVVDGAFLGDELSRVPPHPLRLPDCDEPFLHPGSHRSVCEKKRLLLRSATTNREVAPIHLLRTPNAPFHLCRVAHKQPTQNRSLVGSPKPGEGSNHEDSFLNANISPLLAATGGFSPTTSEGTVLPSRKERRSSPEITLVVNPQTRRSGGTRRPTQLSIPSARGSASRRNAARSE